MALTVYFDASAVVKLFLAEEGAAAARELWTAAQESITSRTTYPEVRAALAAARRDRRLSTTQLRNAVDRLEATLDALDVVELEEPVARLAGELAEARSLRGYDAIHLASALTRAQAAPVVATWDESLRRAALASGLRVAPALTA